MYTYGATRILFFLRACSHRRGAVEIKPKRWVDLGKKIFGHFRLSLSFVLLPQAGSPSQGSVASPRMLAGFWKKGRNAARIASPSSPSRRLFLPTSFFAPVSVLSSEVSSFLWRACFNLSTQADLSNSAIAPETWRTKTWKAQASGAKHSGLLAETKVRPCSVKRWYATTCTRSSRASRLEP